MALQKSKVSLSEILESLDLLYAEAAFKALDKGAGN
jgi:hypothetical protein